MTPVPPTIIDDNALRFAQPLWMIAGLVACACVVALYIRFDRRRDRKSVV